jgi:hypothetical protein
VLEAGPILVATIGLREVDPLDVWTGRKVAVISEDEYELRLAQLKWDRDFAPDRPELQPRKPVSLGDLPPIGPDE